MNGRILSFQFVSVQSFRCVDHGLLRLHPRARRSITTPHPRRGYASGKGSKLPPPKPKPTSKNHTGPSVPSISHVKDLASTPLQEFNNQVIAKKISGTIYLAPSHGIYAFVCWATATGCFLYAAHHGYTVLVDSTEERTMTAKFLWGTLCSAMVAMGMLAIHRVANRVTMIEVIRINGNPQLRFTVQGKNPFRKPRLVVSSPSEVSLDRPVVGRPRPKKTQRKNNGAKTPQAEMYQAYQRLQDLARTPFWKAPGKKTSMIIWRVALDCKRLFDWDAFFALSIKGKEKELKLDRKGAFLPGMHHVFEVWNKEIRKSSS